jgi:hypothetical protein
MRRFNVFDRLKWQEARGSIRINTGISQLLAFMT